MMNDHYSTRIDFDLMGELARRLDEIIQRGIVGSKPEAIRQALTEYFNKLDEQQLRRARLRLLEKETTQG
jgi:metal-responsive CopG/Arc/MetJ family transcriptional regulator